MNDPQIIQKPLCEMPDCENDGFCVVMGKCICGRCLLEIKKKQQLAVFG